MSLIYIIEDEPVMAEVLGGIVRAMPGAPAVEIYDNAVAAMAAVNEKLPDAILLDVLLTGPDGFAFLNELASYLDTARIPVVLMSSLDFSGQDLSHYGVVTVLNKATMTPDDIQASLQNALPRAEAAPAMVNAEIVGEDPTGMPPVQLPPVDPTSLQDINSDHHAG